MTDLCLGPIWTIEPGGIFRDTVDVVGFLPNQNAFPRFYTEVEGTYRLVGALSSMPEPDAKGEDILPQHQRVSDTFEVTQRQ